jgi:hypothetical protein
MIPHKYEGVVRSVPMDAHVGFPCNPVFFAKANMFIKYFQVHSVAGEIHSGQYFQSLDYEDFVRIFCAVSGNEVLTCQISKTGKPNSRPHHPLTWSWCKS